jgi:hypothetical protein
MINVTPLERFGFPWAGIQALQHSCKMDSGSSATADLRRLDGSTELVVISPDDECNKQVFEQSRITVP